MKIVNLSSDDYYSQRNNLIRPSGACMATARVMFYLGNKIPYTIPEDVKEKYTQPEDCFMYILNTPEAWEALSPWIKESNKQHPDKLTYPNEDHFMYPNYLDPILCGKKVSKFVMNYTYDDYVKMIDAGKVIMTTGKFPTTHGHAVCIIGRNDKNFILADPWGDYTTNYTSTKGYGVEMTPEDFHTIIATEVAGHPEQKYAHIPLT
jgi:hypothetical protein